MKWSDKVMIIKCGRREFNLNKDDVIFDNGACYQIKTRTYSEGFFKHYPVIASSKAKKMIKEGNLILVEESFQYKTSDGKEIWYRYYKVKNV
jgi:hypothetical protein